MAGLPALAHHAAYGNSAIALAAEHEQSKEPPAVKEPDEADVFFVEEPAETTEIAAATEEAGPEEIELAEAEPEEYEPEEPEEIEAAEPAQKEPVEAPSAEEAAAESETTPSTTEEAADATPDTEEAAPEAADLAAEEVAEAGAEEPIGAAGEGAPPSGVKGGGEGAPELAEWKAKVSSATKAIKQPDLGEAAGAETRVRAAGGAATGRAAAGREDVAKEAEAAVPPPPKAPDPLPPPSEDPVPDATKLVRNASDKKLPNQSLPVLVATPRGTMPKVGTELAGAYATKVTTEAALAKAAESGLEGEAAASGERNPEKEHVEKIRDATSEKTAVEGREGKGEPLVLVDEGPPPPAPMTKESQTDVAKVLAVLASDPQSAAQEIVTDARRAAYPKGQLLDSNYNEFGDEMLPEVETSLLAQLDAIREQAGISEQDLAKQVAERKGKLEEEGRETRDNVAAAGEDETGKIQEEGQKTADAVAGSRDAVDENTERQVEAASGDTDPAVIKSKRERLIRGVARKVAQQSVAYTQAGERRDKALTDTQRTFETGYTLAARQDETQLFEEGKKAGKTEEDARKEAAEAAMPSFVWLKEKLVAVRTAFDGLKKDAKAAASGLDTAARDAGTSASEMIRAWAEAKLGEHQSFWGWLLDLFKDWSTKAREETAAWEEARNAETRDATVRDLDAMKMVRDLEARQIDGKLAMGMAGLTEEQRAVIQAYYEGPAKGDSIAAVAVGLRMRLSVERRPELIKGFEAKLLGLPPDRWNDVDVIAQVQRPGRDAKSIASDVHQAVDQWGTDEAKIFDALSGLTPLKAAAVRKCYAASGWGDMDAAIESELGGAESMRAKAQLSGDQALADAAALREAISGPGTDEKTIMQVLRNKSPEERKRIIEAYRKAYSGADLEADLESDLGGHDLDRKRALMEGDTARADAIAIDQAMHGGLFGLGTEEKEIDDTFEQIRQEVAGEAEAKGWTTAQMEAEIKRRKGDVDAAYNTKYGRSLNEAFKDELSGPELDLAMALKSNDIVAADMARIEIEKQSAVYASDEAINNVLKSQGERARREVERDEKLALQERAGIDALRGFPWDKSRWESERKALNERIEEKTEERAKSYTSALEKGYDEKYSKIGKGGLRLTIAMNMSGSAKRMAYDRLNQGGILRPEQEIDYAIEGDGTDEDAVKKVLAGKSAAEIKKIREAWEEKHPGESFDERVLSEFSGRGRFDLEIMLDGEPQTPKEKLDQAKKKLNYEQNAYLLGGAFSKEERRQMEAEAKALEDDVERLESLEEGSEEYERAYERYQLQTAYFDRTVEDHRTAVDSVTDTAATIAGIVATVAVMAAAVALTVLTGGAAAPGLAAAFGAVMTNAGVAAAAAGAAAMATVYTKIAFKGSAYGVEEMGVDLAVGAADALASYATAGLGGKLLSAGRLAKLSQSSKVLPRLFANAMAEGAEGFASTLPSALTGAMLDDNNWKGDPFSNIMGSAMVGVGMGTVLSGGMGMLGGLGKPAAKAAGEAGEAGELLAEQAAKHPPIETPEVLARRGTPTERMAGWESFQKANPGKSYDDFIAELDAGVLTHKVDDEAVQQMQKRLRGELFTDIPPGQRDQFKDVAVDVVSDADFERLTRSAKGQAVVLIEGGKPRVLLRESADPKVLREEGIHLLQSVDPKKAHLFKQLDESVLSKWDELPLDEQLSLYAKKLDLEIDGQQRLISNLEEALTAAGDDAAARKQILAQLENAERTLDNLSNRLDEVAELTPQKRLDIANGKAARPDYLDQPARLFSKKTEPKPDIPALKDKLVATLESADLDAARANRLFRSLRETAEEKGLTTAFDAVVEKASKLSEADPKQARAFLDEVDKVMKSWEHTPAAMLSVVEKAAKMDAPNAFLGKLSKIAGVGATESRRVSAGALETLVEKLSKLNAEDAGRLLDNVSDLVDSLPKNATHSDLSGFIVAVTKYQNSGAFVREVKSLLTKLDNNKVPLPAGTLRNLGDGVSRMVKEVAGRYVKALDDLVARADLPDDLRNDIIVQVGRAMASSSLDDNAVRTAISAMRSAEKPHNVREFLAELRHLNEVASAKDLAKGSKVYGGVKMSLPDGSLRQFDLGDGIKVGISPVSEADALYRAGGKINLDEVKHTALALVNKLREKPKQYQNLLAWRREGPDRAVSFVIESEVKWTNLFGTPDVSEMLIQDRIPLKIGGKVFDPDALMAFKAKVKIKYREHVGSGKSAKSFFELPEMSTLDSAFKFVEYP